MINVLTTIACVPLIDKLGRKPLLVYPMAGMLVVFTLITIFLNVRFSFYIRENEINNKYLFI